MPTDLTSESVLRFSPLLTTGSGSRLIVPLNLDHQQGPPAPRERLRVRKPMEVSEVKYLREGRLIRNSEITLLSCG